MMKIFLVLLLQVLTLQALAGVNEDMETAYRLFHSAAESLNLECESENRNEGVLLAYASRLADALEYIAQHGENESVRLRAADQNAGLMMAIETGSAEEVCK